MFFLLSLKFAETLIEQTAEFATEKMDRLSSSAQKLLRRIKERSDSVTSLIKQERCDHLQRCERLLLETHVRPLLVSHVMMHFSFDGF